MTSQHHAPATMLLVDTVVSLDGLRSCPLLGARWKRLCSDQNSNPGSAVVQPVT